MKKQVLEFLYKYKMRKDGYKYVNHKEDLYYGINTKGEWNFYIAHDLALIQIAHCDTKLKAKFTLQVLLNNVTV